MLDANNVTRTKDAYGKSRSCLANRMRRAIVARICLVSCVSKKLPQPAPAQELYVSALFEKSRKYAQKYADRWYILSAKHDLVAPDQVIAPYDETLNDMRKADRDAWARKVLAQLSKVTEPGDTLVFLAGKRYTHGIVPELKRRGYWVEEPMEGLPIGKRLRWLNNKIGNC